MTRTEIERIISNGNKEARFEIMENAGKGSRISQMFDYGDGHWDEIIWTKTGNKTWQYMRVQNNMIVWSESYRTKSAAGAIGIGMEGCRLTVSIR